MTRFLSLSQTRAQLPTLVDQLSEEGGEVIMTVHGQPKVVIMNFEDLHHILDMYAFGMTPETLKAAEESGTSEWTLKDFQQFHGLQNPIYQKGSKRLKKTRS